jgi:hypothetical protein
MHTGASEYSRKSLELSTKLVGLDGTGQVPTHSLSLWFAFYSGIIIITPRRSPD